MVQIEATGMAAVCLSQALQPLRGQLMYGDRRVNLREAARLARIDPQAVRLCLAPGQWRHWWAHPNTRSCLRHAFSATYCSAIERTDVTLGRTVLAILAHCAAWGKNDGSGEAEAWLREIVCGLAFPFRSSRRQALTPRELRDMALEFHLSVLRDQD